MQRQKPSDQTTPRLPTNIVWRVACAMHNADEPLCDWAELPHEDTSYGIGKMRRLRHATVALLEVGQVIIQDARNG